MAVASLGWCQCSRGDVITEWNSLLVNAVKNENVAPPLGARNMAIMHAAIFDAVNAIDRAYTPYFVDTLAPPGTLANVAAASAAYESLLNLFPSQRAVFDSTFSSFISGVPAGSGRDNGLALGRSVADQILAWRSADGASTTVPYIPSAEPGQWRRTPPFFRPPDLPQWPYVTPFAMTNGAQFRPAGPPPLNSSQWAADFNQVKELGALNSTTRTADQTQIARFWSDFSFTVTPPGHWNLIAGTIVSNQVSSLAESARLFAQLNIAMADAAIISWDAKYQYNFWRPVTAIRAGDTDGNPDTVADPNWAPLLNTPSFPEYTSGHSTFSAAAATVMANFFGTDHVSFTIGSDSLPGVLRSYDSLSETAEEIALSRIYAGIHFLSADVDGLNTGKALGEYVSRNFLLPIPKPTTFGLSVLGGLLLFSTCARRCADRKGKGRK